MSEWKDWKPGDKLVYIGADDVHVIGAGGLTINAVYTATEIAILIEGETVLIGNSLMVCRKDCFIVKVAEAPGHITQATLFKRLEEKPEHRGMAILREIASGIRLPEHATNDEALHMLRASRALAWKRGKAWLGQRAKP